MAESKGKRRASVGVLFWVAFILLVLVIFLANRGNIEQVLETTGIVDVIRDRVAQDNETTTEDPAEIIPDATGSPGSDTPDTVATPESEADTPDIVFEDDRAPAGDGSSESDQPESTSADETETVQTRDEPVGDPPRQDVSRPNRRMAALYFIRVTDDGHTYPQRIVRPVDYDESPLTETIRALIAGPSGEELDEGLLNLIPVDTQLISAHVDRGVAYLNFNQSFRFNPMGAEGTVAQLQQIIYSSTEFPTVLQVQFLIEGEKLEYVGGDGIYIGAPLGRDAFSS
jgi:germination protein M